MADPPEGPAPCAPPVDLDETAAGTLEIDASPPPAGESGGRALIVDDDADVRLWLRTTLELHGWTVSEAASASEAIARVRQDAFEVVVLDQMMPAMTGLEAAAALRPDYAGPLVLFSAYLSPELIDQAEALDVVPISKLDQTALLQLLDDMDANGDGDMDAKGDGDGDMDGDGDGDGGEDDAVAGD